MSEPISPQVSDRICRHMNEDHADALLLYAKVFGNATDAIAAEMASIDAEGMNLVVQASGSAAPLRIPFDPVLQTAEEAHHRLIEMVKQARQGGRG